MKQNLFLAALAFVALASCTSDEFVGENGSPTNSNTDGAILFESSTPRVTRASGADAAQELGYSFAVYATKTVGSATSNVFALNTYSSTTTNNTPYQVWYTANTANNTTSNTYNWEYVGAAGTYGTTGNQVTLSSEQTIKYWDYSADNYVFTAYKAKAGGTVTNLTTSGFTFQGTAAQVGDLFVADQLTITEKASPASHTANDNKIGDAVKLTFRSAATKVRLGIYETIPGYVVQNVKFRPANSEFTATTTNATLSGSFHGQSVISSTSTDTYTFVITYDATTKVAQLATSGSSSTSDHFDFGTFASATPTPIGETSITPMWASGSSDYSLVLPNTNNVGNMILKVDYDLYNSVSGETIHVKGAKAVVPSIYMKWNPNYAYTYLFKISDNTNGTTGTEGSSPEGIYPISFDAVTVAATDGQEVGTITTVSTPAITTYQNGSVSSAGITYANANGPIYITVNTDGALNTLTDKIKLYKVDATTTEADLVLTTKTKTEVGSSDADKLTILTDADTQQGITFAASTTAKFTPTAGQTYAVQYKVSAGSASATTADYDANATYYSMTPDSDGFYTLATPTDAQIADWNNYKSNFTTNPTQPVYAYKVILVVAN